MGDKGWEEKEKDAVCCCLLAEGLSLGKCRDTVRFGLGVRDWAHALLSLALSWDLSGQVWFWYLILEARGFAAELLSFTVSSYHG